MPVILTTTEETQRLALYNQGYSDPQIAKALGITANAVYLWRKRREKQAHTGICRYNSGVPMEAALTPDQCCEMRKFLGSMINLADQWPGRYFDVMAYMQEYRKAGLVWKERTGTQG